MVYILVALDRIEFSSKQRYGSDGIPKNARCNNKPGDIGSKLLEYGRFLEMYLHSHGYSLELEELEPASLC